MKRIAGKSLLKMMMNKTDLFVEAEWKGRGPILMASPDSHTDWAFDLKMSLAQFRTLVNALTSCGEEVIMLCKDRKRAQNDYEDISRNNVRYIPLPYNDTWTRDYGLISVNTSSGPIAVDFGFNGWGLKFPSDKDNLVNLFINDNLYLLPDRYCDRRGFIFEGGSMETDGKGTLMTTSRCLLSPNRNPGMSREDIERYLSRVLGFNRVLWLDYGELEGDDTDAHIDTLARFAPGDTILYVSCEDKSDCHYESLKLMEKQLQSFRTSDGKPYLLIPLPMPEASFDDEGNRLPATYANFLATDKNIFLPIYGDRINDQVALERVTSAFPDHHIEPVPCSTLIIQHGSLHCSTMQILPGIFDEDRLRNEQ